MREGLAYTDDKTRATGKYFPALIAVLIAIPLPFLVGGYHMHILIIAFYYIILASSWNLIAGYTGLFSLAHHAFAAIGAYTSALLVIDFRIPILLGIPIGGMAAIVTSFSLGILCLRMRAIYLALATWAFAESLRILISMMYKITRGDLGLSVPLLLGTASSKLYYYIFLSLAVLTVLLITLIMRSRIGYYLRAIRDDEGAAQAMGVDTVRWKIFAFTASSFFAGIAGAFYGHYIGLLSPAMIQFYEMAMIVIMVTIGGIRSLAGPVIGAIVIELLSEALRGIGFGRMVIFAAIVIIIMRVYNEGLTGALKQTYKWIRQRSIKVISRRQLLSPIDKEE